MTDDTAQQPTDDPLEAQIDEILADLVWEFELIRNGMELDHHTKSEAGILERDELEAAKAKLKALLVTASNSNTSLPASQPDSQQPPKFTIPKRGMYRETLTTDGQIVDERIVERDMPDSRDGEELEAILFDCIVAIGVREAGTVTDLDTLIINRQKAVTQLKAYADRLATQRAITELEWLIGWENPETLDAITIKNRIRELSATLTKEGES